jgi:thiol:disulfide interchange protein DsbC
MMLKQVRLLAAAAALALAAPAFAGPEAAIEERLSKMLPEYGVDSISESAMPGVYEVMMGPQVIYMSADGRYMMQGRLIDLETREDLTEPRRAAARKAAVDKVGEEQMVIFAPKDYKHTVTVFTDIDCGYCRKLHQEMDDYLEAGIRVRYVFYPRAGVGSESFNEAVSVWCADDRQQAMTDAKAGKPIEARTCENPVTAHMQLGEQLNISGTPALVLDNGEMLPGYVPANRLSAALKAQGS